LAEKYQIPVVIMTDQYLADSFRNVEKFDLSRAAVKRYRLSKEESAKITSYKRYQLTDTGVSPLAVPSWINDVVYADSDEHTEEGHITEDGEIRKQMVDKRFYKKMSGLSAEIEKPEVYNIEGADAVLLGFGSTYGVMKEAVAALGQKKIGLIHLAQVWPFPGRELETLLKNVKKSITVENNAGAQLAKVLCRETGIKVTKSILKYDGRPFDLDSLVDELKKEI
jgi:2-oxoglutarate ferredoxin oxidoreductase subunit alpha